MARKLSPLNESYSETMMRAVVAMFKLHVLSNLQIICFCEMLMLVYILSLVTTLIILKRLSTESCKLSTFYMHHA